MQHSIFVFMGCMLLLIFTVFVLRRKEQTHHRRSSCLLRLNCTPMSILNVQHRQVFDNPHKAERVLKELGHRRPHLRSLLCRAGVKWTIVSGDQLTVMTSAPTADTKPDTKTEYFYFIQTAPLLNPTLPTEKPIIAEPFTAAPPAATVSTTADDGNRFALRSDVITNDKVRTSRHGTIISAKEDFFREWEQQQGQGCVYLAQSLHPNDTAWYVLSSKKKYNKDELFLVNSSGHLQILDHRA